MLVQYWANVADDGTTLNRHRFNVSYLKIFCPTLIKYWFNVGQTSATIAQKKHWFNVGPNHRLQVIFKYDLIMISSVVCLLGIKYEKKGLAVVTVEIEIHVLFNPHNAEIFLETKGFFQFEIMMNVLISSFLFI